MKTTITINFTETGTPSPGTDLAVLGAIERMLFLDNATKETTKTIDIQVTGLKATASIEQTTT